MSEHPPEGSPHAGRVDQPEEMASATGPSPEEEVIQNLAAEVRDQDEMERNINRQAEGLLMQQAIERDEKRLEKSKSEKSKLEALIRKNERRLNGGVALGSAAATVMRSEVDHYRVLIEGHIKDVKEIRERLEETKNKVSQTPIEQTGNQRLPNESQRDFLIRTGKITPFSKMASGTKQAEDNLEDALYNAEAGEEEPPVEKEPVAEPLRSHRDLMRPGFAQTAETTPTGTSRPSSSDPEPSSGPKRCRLNNGRTESRESDQSSSDGQVKTEEDSDDFDPGMSNRQLAQLGEDDAESDADQSEDDFVMDTPGNKRKARQSKARQSKRIKTEDETEDLRDLDDGNEGVYQTRLDKWVESRSAARRKAGIHQSPEIRAEDEEDAETTGGMEEWNKPHPTIKDAEFEGGYKVPGDIYPALFDYQKTGVQWLWELYSQQVGGIVGDEMGLGKTIQIIAFLAGLHYSNKLTKPVVVVCPATVMKQWVSEFHKWWPALRVSILHSSGSGMTSGRESRDDQHLENNIRTGKRALSKSERAANKIVNRVVQDGHILVTTYAGLQSYAELLTPVDWGYAVLDEGHKIRNPDANITLYCKALRTSNRVILSGTPMQNNLTELWSLFDFIFPMRLGNLVDFKNQFEMPIKTGGYANASNLQIKTAEKCAITLKDAISPYLLQRMKSDIASDLPRKQDRVLFCKLTKQQRQAYEGFLNGDDVKSIMNGRRQVLYGIDILRKICNHPDLADHKHLSVKKDYDYGVAKKSGKMVILRDLVDLWKRGGHKTLVFAQHRIMLDILEKYIRSMDGINYQRMDGNTPVPQRQDMVDEFNNNPDAHVFLLTTKVGGLGVNLTGADRVIIFDPDWNPSTDLQARERAWRLGQKREVEIYRLMVKGTIEEKIYLRQIFKQTLAKKILKDPKLQQSFHMQDLYDLFSLGIENGESETGKMFQGTETRYANGETDVGLSQLAGVAAVHDYQQEEASGSEDSETGAKDKITDKRIMDALFARSGVDSSLEHDRIVNGKMIITTADPEMIDRQARKVAEEAAAKLRKAESTARTIEPGTVTWTGQFGDGGRPPPQKRSMRPGVNGPGSLGVLAGLQQRQTETSASSSRAGTPSQRGTGLSGTRGGRSSELKEQKFDFLTKLRDYFVRLNGTVHTQMLIDHFKRHCDTQEKTAEFKAMLRQIAILHKGSRGRGKWELKDEYRPKKN